MAQPKDQPDPNDANQLLQRLYQELAQLAHNLLGKERKGITIQTGDLVHEAWLRLRADDVRWDGEGHFFAAAAEAMRRVLVDHARRKERPKHGGDRKREVLDDQPATFDTSPSLIISLDEALERLAAIDRRKALVVKLRIFAGLSVKEIAALLNVSDRTVEQDWKFARAWLQVEMSKGDTRG